MNTRNTTQRAAPEADAVIAELVAAQREAVAFLDHSAMLPLDRLSEAVLAETGETLPADRVDTLAAAGWFRVFPLPLDATDGGGEPHVPRLVVSRVGLLLALERDGVTAAELAAFAAEEDLVIYSEQEVPERLPGETTGQTLLHLIDDHLADIEADAALAGVGNASLAAPKGKIVAENLRRICEHQADHVRRIRTLVADLVRLQARVERSIAGIDSYDGPVEQLLASLRLPKSTNTRESARAEYVALLDRLEADLEVLGAGYLGNDCAAIHGRVRDLRAQARAGFGVVVALPDGPDGGPWVPDEDDAGIDWAYTILHPRLTDEGGPSFPIRLPGMLLDGERLTLTTSITPGEYARLWKRYDLETYFRLLARLAGDRRCAHCFSPLPDGASPRRRFCSDSCRAAANTERYRRRHPDRVKASRNGWYRS